jgi:ribosomal protein S25
MPGKKSMSKVERQQEVKEKPEKKEKKVEKVIGSVDMPDIKQEDLLAQFKRMKAITPTEVAIQFNIKVSMAKRLLEDQRKSEVVSLVSQSQNLKIYSLTQK